MTWVKQKLVLAMMSVALLAPPAVGLAQHRDQYLYDKVGEQEKHLDNTDGNVKENGKAIQELRDQINEWKNYGIGFAGCFTLVIAGLKFLGKKGDQSA